MFAYNNLNANKGSFLKRCQNVGGLYLYFSILLNMDRK